MAVDNRFDSSLSGPVDDTTASEVNGAATAPIGSGTPPRFRIGRRFVQSRPVRFVWVDRRVGVGVASTVAASGALISSWWIPCCPLTTIEALGAMALGASVGGVAGVAMRSRWVMLLGAVVFAAVFEVTTYSRRPHDLVEFDFWRGFHGVVGLVPMLLGVSFGAAFTRHVRRDPVKHGGWARVGRHVRRTFAGVSTSATLALESHSPGPPVLHRYATREEIR